MEEKQFYTAERRIAILSELRLMNKVSVNDLSEKFSVSSATVRSDLAELETQGLLKRTHGGAIPVYGTSFELTSTEKERMHKSEKLRIAEYAAKCVCDGDTIAVDSGSTMRFFAEMLSEKSITVVTYDMRIAGIFDSFDNAKVILAGGVLRKGFYSCVGEFTTDILKKLNVDKAFIATNAVGKDGKLSTPDPLQAEVKKRMLETGTRKYLLADGSKFDTVSLVNFADVKDFDCVITDGSVPDPALKKIKENGTEIITA